MAEWANSTSSGDGLKGEEMAGPARAVGLVELDFRVRLDWENLGGHLPLPTGVFKRQPCHKRAGNKRLRSRPQAKVKSSATRLVLSTLASVRVCPPASVKTVLVPSCTACAIASAKFAKVAVANWITSWPTSPAPGVKSMTRLVWNVASKMNLSSPASPLR